MWALVEWVVDNDIISTYSVVNIDPFAYHNSELQLGKEIYINSFNNESRRAKIINLSEDKRLIREHKIFLDRQDQQVKNVMQLCMRTIREMKAENYSRSAIFNQVMSIKGNQGGFPQMIMVNNSDTSTSCSDNDKETRQLAQANKLNKVCQSRHQNVRFDPMSTSKRPKDTINDQRRRSVLSSTPLPGRNTPENIKLCFDQATQTDDVDDFPTKKVKYMESELKLLYGSFYTWLVEQENLEPMMNTGVRFLQTKQTPEVSYVGPNESWLEIETESRRFGKHHAPSDVIVKQCIESENQHGDELMNKTVKVETTSRSPNDTAVIHRMPAHTTYSNDMVPIGNGRAMVPARLYNDINWSSYTSATRQLLQAIFPRKVLATHSLTGKSSPAHQNKPPKKILDPKVVEDIILTVASKSGVTKSLVRNCITIKCTDEAKLYRNRQKYQLSRRQQKINRNDENMPPSTTNSSTESSNTQLLL